MSLSSGRRSHWVVFGSCLTVVALATIVAVHDEPASSGATTTHVGAAATGQSASPGKSASAGGTATASGSGSSARNLYFGLAYGNTLMADSAGALAGSLDEAVSLGVAYVRVDLPWSAVQPNNANSYDWQGFDRIAQAAAARKLKVDAVLVDVPRWARKSSCAAYFSCPPADVNAFAGFAAQAAKRYAPLGLHTWEVWNEPNISAWAPKPDATSYEKLLVATSRALRSATPDAFVILGGLAAVPTSTAHNYVSAYDFLTTVAKLGGNRYVDAVGFHPYSLPQLPSQSGNYAEISSAPNDNLIGVLQNYGTPNVTIWLTETGAPVQLAASDPTAKQAATRQAEQVQAEYAANLVETATANSHVSADFWYSNQDDTPLSLFFGLRRADGTYRPVFATLKNTLVSCGCNRKN